MMMGFFFCCKCEIENKTKNDFKRCICMNLCYKQASVHILFEKIFELTKNNLQFD